MFLRMVIRALVRQWKKMLMIAFTIALGSSLATAMLNVMFDVGDKVNQELKTYGANIRVLPQSASIMSDMYGIENESFLREDELGKLKTIFWAFNIVDFSPYLEGKAELKDGSEIKLTGTWFNHHLALPTGEELDTGMVAMKKWWTVKGQWLSDGEKEDGENPKVMVGSELAKKHGLKLGDTISLSTKTIKEKSFTVSGIFDAGGDEDEYAYVNLSDAQKLYDKSGLISSIEVSALTTPDNDLARKAAQDPSALNQMDWDTWYCTAYVSSICYQIQEVISNSVAKAVRQVAESEGA
ncbi:MAG: ABC transporter permease, partial [Treponema sp.]|nr:ABC transporter permease [Treponema sp.]